jgi:hypothetical protein
VEGFGRPPNQVAERVEIVLHFVLVEPIFAQLLGSVFMQRDETN